MSLSISELEQIAKLACLDPNAHSIEQLNHEINAIMNLIETLRSVDTQNVQPLFHPLALKQRFREDVVTEQECIAQLEELAPLFEDNLYMVPQVIESDK